MEAQKLAGVEKPWSTTAELPAPKLQEKPAQRQPLLYEVPQLSQTEGIGRYRRSVNATEGFIESTINKRNDSFADLSALLTEKRRAGSDEWKRPLRFTGNMDTTSPPPPRKAFSRGNSPVRLAIYGEGVDEVGEEELEERDGKLIFGRRRTRGTSAVRNDSADSEGSPEKTLVTTSDPGVMTTEAVVAAIAQEKNVTGAKRKHNRDEESGRGRRKTFDVKNRTSAAKLKGDFAARIRHVTTSEEIEEAVETDDDDVEEVESFSDRQGEKLMKGRTGSGGSKEKDKSPKGLDGGKRNGRQLRGPGVGAGARTGTGVKAGGPRRTGLRK